MRRQALRLTQEQLAKQVGVHRMTVSSWETGIYPKFHLGALEEVLGISLAEEEQQFELRDENERMIWSWQADGLSRETAIEWITKLRDVKRRARDSA